MTTCLWKSPTGQITNRTHLYLSLHVHEKRVDFLCSTFFQRFSMFFCSIHCNLCHYFDDFPTFFFLLHTFPKLSMIFPVDPIFICFAGVFSSNLTYFCYHLPKILPHFFTISHTVFYLRELRREFSFGP